MPSIKESLDGKIKPNILILGSFEPWSLELSYFRAFQSLGYDPSCFDLSKEYVKVSRFTQNRYAQYIIHPYAVRKINIKLLKFIAAYEPDLIFVVKGHTICPDSIRAMKKTTRALLFIFNPDDPFNPNRGSSSKFIRKSIPEYDCYFIWSQLLIPRLKKAGARRIEYLPFACDTNLHYPVDLSEGDKVKYGSDVSFIGNWDKERENWLLELKNYKLAVWGADFWETKCKDKFIRSCWKGRIVIGEEMSKIVQSSKINLNILRLQNKGAHNMRTFEIPACGGFMLHERSEELLEFFEEGKEIDCFSTAEELKDKIIFYLKNDNLRMKIAEAGYQRLLKSGYCYTNRAKQLLEFIKN